MERDRLMIMQYHADAQEDFLLAERDLKRAAEAYQDAIGAVSNAHTRLLRARAMLRGMHEDN